MEPISHPKNSFLLGLDHIRFGEFDYGGVLYHANYFHLYELAREHFLISKGLPYSRLVAENKHMAIVESHQNFFSPIQYGVKYDLYLWATEIKRSTATLCYEIIDHNKNVLIHRASTKLVFIAKTGGPFKVQAFPQEIVQWLKETVK